MEKVANLRKQKYFGQKGLFDLKMYLKSVYIRGRFYKGHLEKLLDLLKAAVETLEVSFEISPDFELIEVP
jgi:hypothetical protein